MNKINWQTALTAGGVVIGGLLATFWTAHEVVERSYQHRIEAIQYRLEVEEERIEKSESNQMKIMEELEAVQKSNAAKIEISRSHMNSTDDKINKICRLLREDESTSEELSLLCLNYLTTIE